MGLTPKTPGNIRCEAGYDFDVACYSPLKAWRGRGLTANGRRPIVFSREHAYTDLPLELACGQCIGCRLERSRQWAVRCIHESQQYEENSFLTLTYNDDNLPSDGSLNKTHFPGFMKRLRRTLDKPVRYFHCGEYGDELGRPHYHAILFGHSFPDQEALTRKNGSIYYTSKKLERLWNKGHCLSTNVTFETCAYVARYICKKITGAAAADHYSRPGPIDYSTGEQTQLQPEYATMSNGIGSKWYSKFKHEVFPDDFIIINQKKASPPRYYLNQLQTEDLEVYNQVIDQRHRMANQHKDNQTPERLTVREICAAARLNPTRNLELKT